MHKVAMEMGKWAMEKAKTHGFDNLSAQDWDDLKDCMEAVKCAICADKDYRIVEAIEFLTRTITAKSEKQAYDLQINVTEYMIISIWSEDRMGWKYTVTRGVSGTEATQNWAICFLGNPTGNFTFKVAVLKIK